jgi:hypothetical protein
MYWITIQKRAKPRFAALYRPVGPVELPRTLRQPRQSGHRRLATGFARRLGALLASIDFRQLAGPTAVFLLWPPRPRHGSAITAQDHRRNSDTVDRHRQVV